MKNYRHFHRLCTAAWLLIASAALHAANVTFQVNMSAQTGLGTFDPDADTVFVAGDAINNWSSSASELTRSAVDPKIWEGTFSVDGSSGSTVQYKFIKNTAVNGVIWEGNVGDNGAQNRSFVLADTDQSLPVTYFNNVTNSTTSTAHVTFQLDLSVQVQLGNFDPDTGTVTVAGDAINNWNATASALTKSPGTPNLWVGTFDITGSAGSTVAYKFVLNGGTWERDGLGPAGSQNRAFTLGSGDQLLPAVYFNNVGAIPVTVPVTFAVDLGVQIAIGNFDPSGTVSVAGDVLNNWDAAASMLTQSATDPTVWTGSVDVQGVVGTPIQYKFVLNGGAIWEAGGNRLYSLTSTNAQALPKAYFNGTSNLGALTAAPVAGNQLKLSWTAGPVIRLQSASSLTGTWQDVAETQGQSSITVAVGTENRLYRLVGP